MCLAATVFQSAVARTSASRVSLQLLLQLGNQGLRAVRPVLPVGDAETSFAASAHARSSLKHQLPTFNTRRFFPREARNFNVDITQYIQRLLLSGWTANAQEISASGHFVLTFSLSVMGRLSYRTPLSASSKSSQCCQLPSAAQSSQPQSYGWSVFSIGVGVTSSKAGISIEGGELFASHNVIAPRAGTGCDPREATCARDNLNWSMVSAVSCPTIMQAFFSHHFCSCFAKRLYLRNVAGFRRRNTSVVSHAEIASLMPFSSPNCAESRAASFLMPLSQELVLR